EVKARYGLARLRGNAAEIARIGKPARAVAERLDIAVLLGKRLDRDTAARAVDDEALAGLDHVRIEDGRIVAARRRGEAIAECLANALAGLAGEIDLDTSAVVERQHAEIVDAMRVVGVFVRVKHRLDAVDPGVEQLLAQVAPGVDDDTGGLRAAGGAPFEEQRTAAPAVAGVGRIATAPDIADARHAPGRSAAEDGRRDLLRFGHQPASPVLS